MFRNKLMNLAIIILIAITLLGATAFLLYHYVIAKPATEETGPKKLSADEMVALTVETDEVTTNLSTDDFIRIKFAFQVDNDKAKAELEKRKIQVHSAIISLLASTSPDQIKGEKGLNELQNNLMKRINAFMDDGKVVKVFITDKILQ